MLIRLALAAFAVCALAVNGAQAQDWPNRPIRILVGFGAGGGTDITARIVAQPLSEILGQPVVVENRVGQGGVMAANGVATADKDGYTLLMMSNAHVIAPVVNKTLPYDSLKDFEMISMIGTAGLIVVAHPDFPANNVKEFIDVLKKDPSKYNFATGGTGSTQHFGGELINQMVGVKMTHVPFRSAPAAMAAVVGKQVDILFELIQPVLPQLQSKNVKAIGVTSPERFPSVPDIPTFNETGLPGFDVTSWYGLAMTAGTPAPVVNKMREALAKALARPEIAEQIRKAGAIPKTSTPQELSAHISKEIQKWSAVRDKAGIPQN